MRTGRVLVVGVAALAAASVAAPPTRGDDPHAPPTVERITLDETAGHVEEALGGWAERYLAVATPAERSQAAQRYLALASKSPGEPDGWLSDAVQRSGAGIRVVAGRRVVVVMQEEFLAGADAGRLAALFDVVELATERMTGVRPAVTKPTKDDKRPRDRAGRFVVGVQPLPQPASEQAFDAWIATPDDKTRGTVLAFSVAGACASSSVWQAPNHRARNLDPAVSRIVRDLAVRECADAAAVASADAFRARAKERYENDWAPGCLPAEWIPTDEALSHLFFLALDAERAKREPLAAMHAFLDEPRHESAGGAGRVASDRELGLEPLAAVFASPAGDVFRRAGFLPTGAAFEDMKRRVVAEDMCREAETLRWNEATRGAAARQFRAASLSLEGSIAADEAMVEALELEEKDDQKKARAAVQKLGLIEGFEFLAPLPEALRKDDAESAAGRMLPLAVATAGGRHPFSVKEPAEVSLKWAEVKDPYDRLVEHTPWRDKKGMTWGGSAVAATKWTKDLGRWLRLRPCRAEWSTVVVLADGRFLDAWPDGSVIVPGAKGTDIVLVSPSRITCSVPWRDGKSVDADLAAAAADKDAVLALRPWAARRVAAALPSVVAALTPLKDADLVAAMKLLAPYRGGDAAACDAMLARAKDHPDVLAAYLDVCRGTRDPAVLDRIVALGTATDVVPDTLTRVQYVLDGALFRKVTEKGADLAALWDRGRKWLPSVAFAEAEEIRDLHDSPTSFRVLADPKAWGRACIAPTGAHGNKGEGYLDLDVPEAPGSAWLAVRWQSAGGRLTLRGSVTDGRRTKPFALDMPAPGTADAGWGFDVFELGPIPRGHVVLAIDDPCASNCRIDAIAVGAKPLE